MIFAHFQTKRDFVRGPRPFIGGDGTQGVGGGAIWPLQYIKYVKRGPGLLFRTICSVFCINIEA